MSRAWRARAGALTLLGALAVHQGRYLAAPAAEDEHAHTYFSWLVPIVTAVTLVALIEFAGRLVRARVARPARLPSTGRLWLAATAALLTIFVAQEALETLTTHGVWVTPAELASAGGWSVAPLSIAVGGLIALLLRGAARAVEWAGSRVPARHKRPRQIRLPARPFVAPQGSVLARRLAGRAPPLRG
jgi:hypothetical protein